jgi:dienelactone hydrolase
LAVKAGVKLPVKFWLGKRVQLNAQKGNGLSIMMRQRLHLIIGVIWLAVVGVGIGQPVITVQPQPCTNILGTPAIFTVQASGATPLTYQWQQAPDLLTFVSQPGETNSTLTIASVQSSNAGNCRVIVADSSVAVTSAVAKLDVRLPATVQFSSASYTVAENAGNVTLLVIRTGGLDYSVTVDYASADGTATNGLKYLAVAGTLVFGAGETNKTVLVPILNDGLVQGTKYFRVSLTNPGSGTLLGTPSSVVVNITDNDQPLHLNSSTFTVSEEAGFVEVGVIRGDDGTNVVTVDLTTADFSALAGSDYEGVTNTVSFAPGEYWKTVRIPILNDAMPEASETFRVTLSNPVGGQLGAPTTATVTITDTDEAVTLEHPNYFVNEDAGFVRIGVQRGESANFGTIDLITSDATATAGLDYLGVTNTLNFAPGERFKVVDILILNDGLREADETFVVALSNPTGGAVLGAIKTATVKIRDNDPGVQFTRNQFWVRQQDNQVVLSVSRGNDQLLDAFTVDFTTMDGTAFAGRDYAVTKGSLAFSTGEMIRAITVPLLDDGLARSDRDFKVVLSNPSGGMALGLSTNSTVTVTICDMREMLPHRSFGLQVSSNATANLSLIGGYTPGLGVVNRFEPFIDLFPTEASSDLLDWSALATLVRTNTATNVMVLSTNTGCNLLQTFYQVPARNFLTPNAPPTGPYAVGREDRWLTDPSRLNRFLLSTNSSFQIAIWYPAEPRAGSLPLPCGEPQVLEDNSYWASFTDRMRYFVGYAAGGLELSSAQIRYPIVLISPGANEVRHDPWQQAEELASHGYIVVTADHNDVRAVVLPDGTYASSAEGKDLTDAGLNDRVTDLRFIVDQMEQWNLNDPVFAGRLDLSRIAAIGFSWGGGAAAEFCRVDSRVKTAVVLEGYFQNAGMLLATGLPKPVLSIYRSDASDTRLFSKLVRKAIWFQVTDTAHLDIGGFGYYPSGTIASTQSAWEVNRTVNAYVVWFLNKYLKGTADPMPALGDYPRVFNFKQK